MSIRFPSLLAALSLAVCLHVPNAFAALSVTATQATGLAGQDVDVTLTVTGDGLADEVDLSRISAYTFNFLWDSATLGFNGYSSFPALSAPTLTVGAGSAVIDWLDGSFSNPTSFAGGLSVTANFHILSGAALGPSTIVFGDVLSSSILVDDSLAQFGFSDVTGGNLMQVTVQQASVVPEPAEVSMLLAGLGIMAGVLHRRRNRKAAT